jgi:hypothetical protein
MDLRKDLQMGFHLEPWKLTASQKQVWMGIPKEALMDQPVIREDMIAVVPVGRRARKDQHH